MAVTFPAVFDYPIFYGETPSQSLRRDNTVFEWFLVHLICLAWFLDLSDRAKKMEF